MTTLPTSALMIYFNDYEQYHQHKLNRVCHLVGVPAVSLSLIGLLSYVVFWTPSVDFGIESLFRIDLGLLAALWGAIFAFRVDRQLAIPFTLFSYLIYLTTRHLPVHILIGMQVSGWVIQFLGHYVYEKKFP